MVSPEIARDFVYVDDVVEALTDFEPLAELKGEVFNLGSGRQTTLGDVVEAVQATVGDASEVRWGAFEKRHWGSANWLADPTRTRDTLGWSAQTTLQEGIRRTAAWSESRGESRGGTS